MRIPATALKHSVKLLVLGMLSFVYAQPDAADIHILSVDDHAYPQLDIYISVIDSQRLSIIPGLTSANFFGDTDNGQPMEIVEAVQQGHPVNVVVLLDITGSVSQEELDNQRLAVAELMESMTPADQLGVVVMDEAKAEVAVPLQSSSESITTTLNTIQIREDATGNVFWDGVYGALTLLQTSENDARQVVVVMTDVSPSGAEGTRNQDEVLSLAIENQVEIFGLYFEYEGDGIPEEPPILPPEMTILSEATGGFTQGVAANLNRQSEDYTDDQALAPMMQNITRVLQSLYRVRFNAPLPVDGTEHNFTVRVDIDGTLTPPVTGSFKAGDSAILVTFPDIEANQNITLPATIDFRVLPREGQISTVKVTAMTSSGQEIELPTEGEYAVMLERNQFAPGQVTLTILVEDNAGNTQETELSLNIIDSLAVDFQAAMPQTLQEGETLRLIADIGFAASVQQVEFLVNGEVAEVKNSSPFDQVEFVWKAPQAGNYTLEIAAQDIQGQRASAQTTIRIGGVAEAENGSLSPSLLAILAIAFVGGVGLSAAGIWILRHRVKVVPVQQPVKDNEFLPPPGYPVKTTRQTPANAELEGPNGERWQLVEGQNTIGRHSSNHIQVLDESVSRHHGVIEVVRNHYYYMDLPTASHPSEINGALLKAEQRYELRDGSLIRMGSSLMRFTQLDKQR